MKQRFIAMSAFFVLLSLGSLPAQAQKSCAEFFKFTGFSLEARPEVSPALQEHLEAAKLVASRSRLSLDSHIEVTGKLSNYILDARNHLAYLSFAGPTRLSDVLPGAPYRVELIPGQGEGHHPGFGTAVGSFVAKSAALEIHSKQADFQTAVEGLVGQVLTLQFESGVVVAGQLKGTLRNQATGTLSIMTFENCRVTYNGKTLFAPSWGIYDMAVGESVSTIGF
jgi:phenylalanine-4-hydroxylase